MSKDTFYVATFPHEQLWLVATLWIFALLAPLWTFFSVFFMTHKEYKKKYGPSDINNQKGTAVIWHAKFTCVKILRGIREMFSFHSYKDWNTKKTQRRILRHKFVVAFLENLPQSVLQLYETFSMGKTYGAFIIFSTSFSIIMF